MQHEIKASVPLLNGKGDLTEPGYAKKLLPVYSKKAVKASPLRLKEWDYYLVYNDDFGVALTIDDNSYMALDSITLLDFNKGWQHTNSPMKFMTLGKKNFPSSSKYGNVKGEGKGYRIEFLNGGSKRILTFHMDNFLDNKPIDGRISLTCNPCESMVIVTPYKESDVHFYYNQKINCMPAEGKVTFDGRDYVFNSNNSYGVLDWSRGVWPYKNTRYWGSASGRANDHLFGFNVGYGFGDTSAANENMLFYDDSAHKLSQVTFNIPMKDGVEDYMSPWTFTSDDGRFEMDFIPILDRTANTNFFVVSSNQHQVFGRFSGTVILDDGTKIKLKNFMGFAEKVSNRW